MKSSIIRFGLIFILISMLIFPSVGFAKKVRVKLGTFAPESTFWVKDLKKMGAHWKKKSKGKVKLTIYAGGVAGDEPTMVRKLVGGQLTAATLTVIGLYEIVPDVLLFTTPYLFRNDAEVQKTLELVGPIIEEKFEKRGFKVLHWSSLGWVYMFTKQPYVTPDQMLNDKLYINLPEGGALYRAAGFKTEEISPLELLKALSPPFPMVSGFATAPVYALANQWFGLAKNMMDLPIAPVLGATIVRKKTWDKIDPALHDEFLDLARGIGKNAEVQIGKFDAEARRVMKDKGLTVHTPDDNEVQNWRNKFEPVYPMVKEKMTPELFEKMITELNKMRTQS